MSQVKYHSLRFGLSTVRFVRDRSRWNVWQFPWRWGIVARNLWSWEFDELLRVRDTRLGSTDIAEDGPFEEHARYVAAI